jgi:hypothetical protein
VELYGNTCLDVAVQQCTTRFAIEPQSRSRLVGGAVCQLHSRCQELRSQTLSVSADDHQLDLLRRLGRLGVCFHMPRRCQRPIVQRLCAEQSDLLPRCVLEDPIHIGVSAVVIGCTACVLFVYCLCTACLFVLLTKTLVYIFLRTHLQWCVAVLLVDR